MNTRLQQFLSAENLTQAQFADELGVARASVSHILAGRNRPGFEFIENLSRHYPSVNLEWFITGKGKMYKSTDAVITTEKQQDTSVTDSSGQSAELLFDFEDDALATEKGKSQREKRRTESDPSRKHNEINENKKIITKVLLFYSDGSFEEYARQ